MVRTSETSFPANKALLVRPLGVVDDRPVEFALAFVDGSASVVRWGDVSPLVEGFYGGSPTRGRDPWPCLETLDGVHGRDVDR